MLARPCSCLVPRAFERGVCHRCGKPIPVVVSPRTGKLALVLARFLMRRDRD